MARSDMMWRENTQIQRISMIQQTHEPFPGANFRQPYSVPEINRIVVKHGYYAKPIKYAIIKAQISTAI